MSLFSISFRTPLSTRCEAPTVSTNVSIREDDSPKIMTRLDFMRQIARDSFRKSPVYIKYLKVSRSQVFQVQHGEHPIPIRSVPVQVAHELIDAGYRSLDVRTVEEYDVEHVEGAINIPYLVKYGSGMQENHQFVEEVAAKFGKDDSIVLGCQIQGDRRSKVAAFDLVVVGFVGITYMEGGFLAWKESGLPTIMNAE